MAHGATEPDAMQENGRGTELGKSGGPLTYEITLSADLPLENTAVMRLFLIPISTGRTLLYCKRIDAAVSKQLGYLDRATNKAAATWAKWEAADKGWKKSLVTYGHKMLQRIPYQEWGLKSVPPLSTRRQIEELQADTPIELLYPENAIENSKVLGLLKKLATERQALHRKRMWWSFIVAPLTAPVALIPIIPNIPFFFFVYRGWSHWRALSGSKHLEFLLNSNLIKPRSLPELEYIYASHFSLQTSKGCHNSELIDEKSGTEESKSHPMCDEKMLLEETDGKSLAKLLDAPELVAEVERAVRQVQQHLNQPKGSK
ncbi:hypothetical protein FQN57_004433 [Myotisia sp. PD_48]|nr:hypothetical protein FQN57_004433 [Myotisia sp. PD_48]